MLDPIKDEFILRERLPKSEAIANVSGGQWAFAERFRLGILIVIGGACCIIAKVAGNKKAGL